MSETFKIIIDIQGNNQASGALGSANSGLGGLFKAAGGAQGALGAMAGAATAAGIALAAMKAAKVAAELTEMGGQVQAIEQRFVAFAGGGQRANEFLEAFQRATDGTVSKMTAMTASAKLLGLGVVENAEQMEVMAAIAVKLGDQTASAESRLETFAQLMKNQSIRLLDDFTISSARVTERMKELQASTAGLSKEQAFLQATLEEGQKALGILGDTSGNINTKIAQMDALAQDIKDSASQWFAEFVQGTGILDTIIGVMESFAIAARKIFGTDIPASTKKTVDSVEEVKQAYSEVVPEVAKTLVAIGKPSKELEKTFEKAQTGVLTVAEAYELMNDRIANAVEEGLEDQLTAYERERLLYSQRADAASTLADSQIEQIQRVAQERLKQEFASQQVAGPGQISQQAQALYKSGATADTVRRFIEMQTARSNAAVNSRREAEIRARQEVQQANARAAALRNAANIQRQALGLPLIPAQHGFNGIVGPGFGGPVLAGEGLRPERVTVQPLSSTTNNFTQNFNGTPARPDIMRDFALARALAS